MKKRRTQNDECRVQKANGSRHGRVALAIFILYSAFCICCSGCNAVGAVLAKTTPPPMVKAQYAPPKEPLLVLVENPHNRAALQLEADAVTRQLVDQMRVHQVAPVIDPSDAEALRNAKGPAYRRMPIDQIGREVGATQVIYVNLERFEIERAVGSELPSGEAQARVRVVSTDNGDVVWPLDSAGGHPLTVKVQPQHTATQVPEQAVRQQLYAAIAERVAKLFYDWSDDNSMEAASENSER
jgi:hypothetical protein